jgi:hypothetical protein
MTDSLSSYKPKKQSPPMAENSTNSKSEVTNRLIEPIVLIRRIAFGIAIATWVVMAIGSATRVMNAGLACPDWPLCYGSVLPAEQMNLQVNGFIVSLPPLWDLPQLFYLGQAGISVNLCQNGCLGQLQDHYL